MLTYLAPGHTARKPQCCQALALLGTALPEPRTHTAWETAGLPVPPSKGEAWRSSLEVTHRQAPPHGCRHLTNRKCQSHGTVTKEKSQPPSPSSLEQWCASNCGDETEHENQMLD